MIDAKTFYTARPSHKPTFVAQGKAIRTEDGDHLRLTDDELMICNHEMPGFSLTDKRWCFLQYRQYTKRGLQLTSISELTASSRPEGNDTFLSEDPC